MFKYISLAIILIQTCAIAQRPFHASLPVHQSSAVKAWDKSDDFEILMPGNWENADSYMIYTVDLGGYVAGNNGYGDLAKAQVFMVDEPYLLHGAYFWVGVAEGGPGKVHFTVWDFPGHAGEILSSVSMSISEIIDMDFENEDILVIFDPPLLVERDYLLGIELSDIDEADIAIVTTENEQGSGLELVWEQWDNGQWVSFLNPNSWELDVDMGIFPIITRDSSTPEPDEGIANIRVTQRTDGSGLVDVTYDFSASAGQYLIDLELSLDGGSSYRLVNPTFLSNYWPVTPGNDRQLILDAAKAAPDASTQQARLRLTPRSGLLLTTSPASGITSETASITGEVLSDGGHAITARGVAYGTALNPLSTGTSVAAGSGTGPFTAELSGLEPNTTYYARAWATNNQGTTYGNQVSFTTLSEGPIVIHGPDGSYVAIPEEAADAAPLITIHEHHPIVRQGELAASSAVRISISDQTIIHSKENYTISIPVTLKDIDPNRLRMNVLMDGGAILPVNGHYDHATASFQVNTFGFASNWALQVVSGPPPTVITSSAKTGQFPAGDTDKIWNWPSLDFTIFDYSAADPRPLTQDAIRDHILPVARDVMTTLHNSGFAAPMLQLDSADMFHIILADTLPFSYYEPPFNELLGRIFISYESYISDYSDPSTWRLSNVIMHEAFHAVQWAYGFTMHDDSSYFHRSRMNTSSAYLEGTASLAGATYEHTGSLTSGKVFVDFWQAHDLGHPVDDFLYSNAYEKQDFFAFIAKRYFNGSLTHLDPMWLAFGSEISTPLKRSTETGNYLLQFRKDMDHFLQAAGTSLPRAYTEYALQRLYLHEKEYLLRENEKPSYGGDLFLENRLAKHLFDNSNRHFDWESEQSDTLLLQPLSVDTLRPMASAAVTLHIPQGIPNHQLPDSLHLNIRMFGGEVSQDMDEQGVRILIIRAEDELGKPVQQNPTISVDDISKPIAVSLGGGVTNLVFLLMNAYVNENIVRVEIETEVEREGDIHNKTRNIWYAKESSGLDFAVDQANEGDTLIVYPGTYDARIRLNGKNVKIWSHAGPEQTIIEARPDTRELSPFRFRNGVTRETELKGFTIKGFERVFVFIENASPTITDNIFTERVVSNFIFGGGGIYIINGSPLIEKNLFVNNAVNTSGGAIYLDGGSPVITKNQILNNTADYYGGGIYVHDGSPVISENTISGNTEGGFGASGGGIHIWRADEAVIENNILEGNVGGGIRMSRGGGIIRGNTISGTQNGAGINLFNSTALVEANEIFDNHGLGGGGISIFNGAPLIRGNTIYNNTAGHGGGIHISGSSPQISNNIISDNRASTSGGGLHIWVTTQDDPQINQNTITDNTAGQDGGGIYIVNIGTATITGNTISDNHADQRGGGINGHAAGWDRTTVVTVSGNPRTVNRHAPCFTESTNTYSGNTHGITTGAWGPGEDNWCEDSGYNVYVR